MQSAGCRFQVSALAMAMVSAGAQAQPTSGPPARWAGWARCEFSVRGPGYSDHQTHTWTLTGDAPKVEGAFRIYSGTWSVVGGGSLEKSEGNQKLLAQWATNVTGMSSPIAVFVRASDGRMLISARHAQLRARGAVAGYQQVTIDGKPRLPGQISLEAFEWAFPVANGPATSQSLNGSSTVPVNGKVGPMQPADSRGTASCTWQFGQGSAAPAPPPAVMSQAVPTAGAAGGATEQPTGKPAGGVARGLTCVGAPQGLAASESATTPGTVSIKWAAPASGVATSYVFQAAATPGGPASLANYDLGNASLGFSVPDVAAGSYYVRVLAIDRCGMSAPSNEVLLVVREIGTGADSDPTCPTPPRNLVGTATPQATPTVSTTHTISLQWDPPASGVANAYTIKAGSAPGLSDLRNFTMASSQTSTSFGAAAGSFYIRVNVAYSSCAAGGSSASNEVLVTVP